MIDWREPDGPRRAGVSALGVGGVNVHVCLEQAPARHAMAEHEAAVTLMLSARSDSGLQRSRADLAAYLRETPDVGLADVAHTLATGRSAFAHRAAIVADSLETAIARLEAAEGAPDPQIIPGKAEADARPVIFMFPGQGAQYPAMGADLYAHEPVYRGAVDQCAEILEPYLGLDLRQPLYGPQAQEGDGADAIRQTILAQPAIFTVEYALAQLWLSRGVRPAAMIGHSVGEFVAATIAHVMSLEDALGLIAARGRLMQAVAPGAMLAVRLPEAQARALLPEGVDIAAVNAPGLTVAAGPFDAIERLETALTAMGAMHRRLYTSHAFHSAMMEPVLPELARMAAQIRAGASDIPYVSCVTGDWITEAETGAPDYWARHCRAPVRFSDGVAALLSRFDNPVLLEVGPGATLSTLCKQGVAKGRNVATVTSLPEAGGNGGDALTFHTALGQLWRHGATFDRAMACPGQRIPLPGVPFEHQSHWIAAPAPAAPERANSQINFAASAASAALMQADAAQMNTHTPVSNTSSEIAAKVAGLFEEISGETIAPADYASPFLELGFDSLFLAQVATQVQKSFKVKVTFRQLLNDMPSIALLADFLVARALSDQPVSADRSEFAQSIKTQSNFRSELIQNYSGGAAAPAESVAIPMPVAPQAAAPAPVVLAPPLSVTQPALAATGVEGLFRDQLAALQGLIAQQNQILLGQAGAAAPVSAPVAVNPTVPAPAVARPITPPPAITAAPSADDDAQPSRHQLYRPGATGSVDAEMTAPQQAFLADLIARYAARTPGSKRMTDARRDVLADPRTAAGFRQEWKEIVYPIVCDRSKGSRIWDVDGNEYIDVVNGYGQTAFGHAPDFVLEAMERQMRDGFAIGPQSPLAGEVAAMFAQMTGNERVTFCNTGSEAVMAAMRVARAVTGRDRIVVFNGGYHGQFDEVLVKGKARQAKDPRGLPIAPGIPAGSVGNMVVLPWAQQESLDWIRANSDDIAAVIAEPVQSRHPEVQPAEFLRELRAITESVGSALVFDEVVTGFRVHPGGMQAVFGVRADMATYGKVLGGGMPIGVLAGKRAFMDALDGGAWRYGDDSTPEVAPTFFAGTFVRHPLVLAAAKAVLLHLQTEGPALQERLASRSQALAARINAELARRGIGARAESYSSWFYLALGGEDRMASLFYHHMRLLGVHWQEGFPCYFTTAHTDADMAFIFDAFVQTLDALQSVGILAGSGQVGAGAAIPAVTSCPLTEPQMEVWLAAQLGDEASCAFNESISLTLSGPLDQQALGAALTQVVARHEALRARFAPDGAQMLIDPPTPAPMDVRDVSDAPDGAAAALAGIVDDEARTPFDLVNGPLMRAILVRLGPTEHVLVFTAHHIVCDGWSANVILDELSQLYRAIRAGRAADLPAPMPFSAYANQQATSPDGAARAWWLSQFQTLPPDADLPADRPRGDIKDWSGDTLRAHIPGDLLKQVKLAGARQGATLFSTLAAAFNVLLWRLTGETDQAAAIPTAGQSLTDGAPLVGHCVNFLPLRTMLDPEAPAAALLKTVQKAMLDMNEHQDFTFGALVRELGVSRNPSRLPLTQVQFNLERVGEGLDFGDVRASVETNAKAFINFDIFLNIVEEKDGLKLACDYSTALYDAATIARWLGHFEQALRAFVADVGQPVKALPLMDSAAIDLLAHGFNNTARAGLDLRPVPLLVADVAAVRPDAIALGWRDQIMTYGQLDAASGALAARIAAVAPGGGGRIGVLVERSPAMVVAMLAVMRAGHAFTPLDPAHPEARLQQVIAAARICALVSDDPARATIAGGAPLVDVRAGAAPDIDAALLPDCASADAAYVIFTSGSTGAPKGVEIGHAALANLLWSFAERPGFTAADTMLAVTTTTFDIAMLELFMPLVTGGKVIIADRQAVQDGFALARLIDEKRPSHIQATPSLWRMLYEAGFRPWPGLTMLCGGEPLPRDLAMQLSARVTDEGSEGALWNVYGPTETTIWSSAGQVLPTDDLIVIGAPVLNTGLYVIDASGQLALPGAPGELAIGGLGLANGYFGQPELTAAAFRLHAVDNGFPHRLYFTGDMAKRLPDGRIQHLGRRDLQIKLRGFRIELEDIESALRALPGVADAAAGIIGFDKDRRLAAWVVMAPGQALDEAALRTGARSALPDYMVPGIWMQMDALPLTANGKLNRKALPQPQRQASRQQMRDVVAPRNATEAMLCGVWADVLGGDGIGIDSDIFDLGADSIQIFQIVARARRAGVNIAARDILRHRNIGELAAAINTAPEAMAAAPAGPLPRLADFRRRALQ